MTRTTYFLCGLLLGLTGIPTPAAGQDLGLSKLGQQCAAVGGDDQAAWRTIDWQTDLIVAQQRAVEQQKPLFIWAMDGHPLGCT